MIKPKICRPGASRSMGWLRPRRMSLVWISKPVVSSFEEQAMWPLVFYFCVCTSLCRCHNFNPSLCHLSPFLHSYVTVFEAMLLVGIKPNRTSLPALILGQGHGALCHQVWRHNRKSPVLPVSKFWKHVHYSVTQFLFVAYNTYW